MRLVSGFVLFCTVFIFHPSDGKNLTTKQMIQELHDEANIKFNELTTKLDEQKKEIEHLTRSSEMCSSSDQMNTLQTLMATDECETQTHNCSEHAICTDKTLYFQCSCLPGYPGDGYTCEDFNECADDPNICSGNEKCINVVGGDYRCCFEVEGLGCLSLGERMTWSEAKDKCDADGASLVNSFNKQQLISIRELFDYAVWVGVKSGVFVLPNTHSSDDVVTAVGNPEDDLWGVGEPDGSELSNNDCGFVNNNSSSPYLNDINCSLREYSLCQFLNY